jgi:hypothetical protein
MDAHRPAGHDRPVTSPHFAAAGHGSYGLDVADPRLGTPQQRLALACAEADRLGAIADQEQARLRDARRARAAFERDNAQSLALADPRRLADAKQAALHSYRAETHRTHDRAAMVGATAIYLRELTRLNRAARQVAGRTATWTTRLRELDDQINQLQMSAEAARVAAEAAQAACADARRALVRHDEELVAETDLVSAEDDAPDDWQQQLTAIEALLRGDRAAFQALVRNVAEAIGLDASRLQLLLLELRQALFERARAAAVLHFAPDNRFWAQFSRAEARAIAAALELLNRGFDGRDGWQGGRVAEPREVAIAVSMAGQDPRLLRVRPTREDLAALWAGTTVDTVEYVRERSPDLALETFEPLLGERAAGLTELWDNWGRLRRVMLSPA